MTFAAHCQRKVFAQNCERMKAIPTYWHRIIPFQSLHSQGISCPSDATWLLAFFCRVFTHLFSICKHVSNALPKPAQRLRPGVDVAHLGMRHRCNLGFPGHTFDRVTRCN